jgi:tetratricopeptide (TPR) repeat protein
LLIGSLAASAQQSSRELQNLQETTRDLYQAGEVAEALRLAERASPLIVREYGAEHEQMGVHTYTLGMLNETLGDFTVAERYFAQSVRIREKVYGPESAGVAMALENLAGVQIKAGRIDAAEPNVRRALKIRQARSPDWRGPSLHSASRAAADCAPATVPPALRKVKVSLSFATRPASSCVVVIHTLPMMGKRTGTTGPALRSRAIAAAGLRK